MNANYSIFQKGIYNDMQSLLFELYEVNGSEKFTSEDIKFRLDSDQSNITGNYNKIKKTASKLFNDKDYDGVHKLCPGLDISWKRISELKKYLNKAMAYFESLKKNSCNGSGIINIGDIKKIKIIVLEIATLLDHLHHRGENH